MIRSPVAAARPVAGVGLLLAAGLLAHCRCGDAPPAATRRPAPAARHPTASPPPDAATTTPARPANRAVAPARTPSSRRAVREASPPPDATTPTPARQVTLPPGLRRRGARLDIDLHRVEVRTLLQRLALVTGTNLVLFDDVQGRVTVQMNGVPRFSALERVARAVGLRVERSGGMILVRSAGGSGP